MSNKSSLFFLLFFLLRGACFGAPLFETENFTVDLGVYSRTDVISFKNTVDLDSANSDDTTTYLGIDYSLSALVEPKTAGPTYFFKLERNGPGDYNAPLFAHNTLMTSGGVVEEYRNDELLPNIEEFWVDAPLRNNLGIKLGLYAYEVGEGLSLSGAYENYGATLYKKFQNSMLRLYYARPDSFYKVRLGPRIRQDEEQDYRYEHNAANFFAADIKYEWEDNYLNPYIGALTDYTSSGKRDSVFSAPIKRDILGTLGLAFSLKGDKLSFTAETARNFGKGKSESGDFKDIYHAGYMLYTDTSYAFGKLEPFFKFLLASGNKVSLDAAQNGDTLSASGKNRAFSYYSPLNFNLDDSIGSWHCEIRPLVFMGSCYSLVYGIPRPETFAASDFDNLIILAPGFDLEVTPKLDLSFDYFYLQSLEKGVGTLDGQARYLSRELGHEMDITAVYKLNKNTLLEISGGYFIPGKYYKEFREDAAGSLFSPFVRGDGKADPAYMIETSVEFIF